MPRVPPAPAASPARPDVPYPSHVTEARFEARPNRYRVHAALVGDTSRFPPEMKGVLPSGGHVPCFCPDPGRLTEFLDVGRPLLVAPVPEAAERGRKTAWDLLAVMHNREWVSLDTRVPNVLFRRAFERGALAPFRAYDALKGEVTVGRSRLDFRLTDGNGAACLVEVKSATLVADHADDPHRDPARPRVLLDDPDAAYFPDAVTARGARHCRELAAHARDGGRAAIAFMVQRASPRALRPHADRDPDFAAALAEARDAGVGIHAWACEVTPAGVRVAREIPVVL